MSIAARCSNCSEMSVVCVYVLLTTGMEEIVGDVTRLCGDCVRM